MNWLINIIDTIKYKIVDSIDSVKFSVKNAIWDIQDKLEMWKLDREIEKEERDQAEGISGAWEEVEVKPKKKKVKKKSVKKAKKSV